MRVFIINLKEKVARYEAIKIQLNKTSFNYQFIEAIKGADLSDKELKKIVYDYPNCKLTKAEVGCALSHLKIYQKIVDENIDIALILEDDAVFPADIEKSISKIVALDDKEKPNVYLLSAVENYVKNRRLHSNVFKVYDAATTHAYLINQQAAKRFLSLLRPIKYEADRWEIFRLKKYANIYCIIPHLINYDVECDSSITEERQKVVEERSKYRKALSKKHPLYHYYRLKALLVKKCFLKIEKYK